MYRKDKCRRCDAPCSSSPTKCVECALACYCSSKCQADDRWRHEVDCKVATVIRECSGCGVSKAAMQQCGNCLEVWYCNGKCQRKDWSRHKPQCLSVSQDIIRLANMLGQLKNYQDSATLRRLYYWGNMPAVDLINLSLSEGSDYASPLSLLLCGVGDPRNVALSLASLPESYQDQLTFVLNDISVCTLARTVLLLYMLFEGSQKEAKTVTQVWYSLRIDEHSYKFLAYALQRLVQTKSLEELTRGTMTTTEQHLKALKRVWLKWLHLSYGVGACVTEGRSKMFDLDPQALDGLPLYLREIPSEHRASAKRWFKDGVLLPESGRLERENVTLTGSWALTASGPDVEFAYCIESDGLPFTSWDYRDAKAFHSVPSLQEMYSEYVSHVLAKCASRLVSGQVKFRCILSNCLEMQPFLPEGLLFDRVLTTNLCDFIPLPTLLGMCRPLLNQANSSSVIVTESLNWRQYFPEVLMTMMKDFSSRILMERVARDTGNPAIATSDAMTAFTDYYLFNLEFQKFLHAVLLSEGISDLPREKQILPSLKSLALKRGLILRDYLRNGNKICPFKWPINCRRVTQLTGFERAVEWVLADKKMATK